MESRRRQVSSFRVLKFIDLGILALMNPNQQREKSVKRARSNRLDEPTPNLPDNQPHSKQSAHDSERRVHRFRHRFNIQTPSTIERGSAAAARIREKQR